LGVLGCDRKCEPCPLLELRGGIEQYGLRIPPSLLASSIMPDDIIKCYRDKGMSKVGL